MSHIFISYARETEAQAQRVEAALRGAGYQVWRDDQIGAHQSIGAVLEERLAAARAVLVLWSADAARSEWVRSEASRARAMGKLVQLTLDKSPLPMPFDQIQCANLVEWSGDTDAPGWRKVLASVDDLMGGAGPPATRAAIAPRPTPSKPSIVVMPFLNLSGDPEQEHFADGMTVEIVEALARIRSIFAVASGSSLSLKGKAITARDAARQMGVQYVLEGSVRKAGQRARIGVQLIDATDGARIWTHRFEDSLEDVFAVQDRVALVVAGTIVPTVLLAQPVDDAVRAGLTGERREIYGLFSDLQGFHTLSDGLDDAKAASLLNGYLELVSQAFVEYGGTIDKFIGDSMVAFWGAPVSRPDDGERAVRAAISIWQVGEAFRNAPMGDLPSLGSTRVGLHRGMGLVGNFGGEGRTSYSAVGAVMTVAARLESANKDLQTKLLISREALPATMIEGVRVMGRIRLRAQSTPVDVFEVAPDFPVEARQGLNRAYARFDAGDAEALDDIRALGAAFQDDLALANLIRRLEQVGPGGAFPLA